MFDLDHVWKEYDEKGCVKVPSFFSKAEIDEMERELAKFVKETVPKLKGREINYSDGEINSIHALSQNSEYFRGIMQSEKVTSLARRLLNDEPEARHMEFFAKPAFKGLPSPFHQDNFYWGIDDGNGLTIWIALDVCDETNGAVTYFKGSHKNGLLNHVDSNAPGSSQKVQDLGLLESMAHLRESFPLLPGDVQIHHSFTIHGSASNPSPRSRRGITMQFKGKKSKYDTDLIKHYEARLQEQLKARGQI